MANGLQNICKRYQKFCSGCFRSFPKVCLYCIANFSKCKCKSQENLWQREKFSLNIDALYWDNMCCIALRDYFSRSVRIMKIMSNRGSFSTFSLSEACDPVFQKGILVLSQKQDDVKIYINCCCYVHVIQYLCFKFLVLETKIFKSSNVKKIFAVL